VEVAVTTHLGKIKQEAIMERQCCECHLPEFPIGTKLSHGLCKRCTIVVYPEHPELHNVPDPDGTYYIQTGGDNG
jgi:hypothetical protein